MDLKQEIEKINNDIPNINYGGCGTFSYHLNKVLQEKNIQSEIYYLPGPPAAIKYDIEFSHIVIKVDDVIIDNNGFYYNIPNSWTNKLKPLSEEKLKEMINIQPLWNDKFKDKEELIKRIYKLKL